MRNLILALTLFIALLGTAPSVLAQDAEDAAPEIVRAPENGLSAMSFNIRYGTANDGEDSWPYRQEMVVEMLREYAPDLIGTQEILDFQVDYLAEGLPEYAWLGVGRDADGSGEMTAIFYRRDAFNVQDSGHFWLSETPDVPGSMSWDTSLTRMASWLSLHHPASGLDLLVMNTHFDHRGVEARLESAKLMVDKADALEAEHDAILVLGDFNTRGGSTAPWQVFDDAGYLDAWLEAPETAGPETTWSAFQAPNLDADSRIDWILYRGAVSALFCETVTYNQDGRYPSDHYPVYATFALGETSGDTEASEQ